MQKAVLVILAFAVLHGTIGQRVKCVSDSKYFVPNFSANWYKAVEYCNYIGMRLAVISNPEEQSKVVELVRSSDKFDNSTTLVWIGASDLAEEGTFCWISTGRRVQYTHWKGNQPDNARAVEHCLEIRYVPAHDWNWQWNDCECTAKRYFVCENLEPGREIVFFG